MGVVADFAAFYRHTPASIRTGQVGRKVQIEEVIPEWRTVRGLSRGAGTNGQYFVRARPVRYKFGLEYLGVRVSLHTLRDGGSRVVHPSPTTHSEFGCRTQRVAGGISAVKARNGEGMAFANNVVRALLSVGGQVTIGQVVTGQAPVSRNSRAKTVRGRRGSLPM